MPTTLIVPRVALAAALVTGILPMTVSAAPPTPPVAERIPHPTVLHGDTLPDDYYWMREKTNPKVIAYLEAENAYTEAMTAGSRPQQEALYKEMLSRIKQTDLSVPYRKGGFFYYSRTEEGKQYSILCRRKGTMESAEEVLLDINVLAEGHPFMAVGDLEVSPDGQTLAFTTDSTGFRQYTLRLKDLRTGEELTDRADRVTSVAWAADNRTLFYTQEDTVSKRSYLLFRHEVGATTHERLYEETDERFEVEVGITRSREWLVQTRASHRTSEVAVLPAATPLGAWRVIAPRVQDRDYSVDHRGDRFWIRVNDTGKNFRLVTAPVADPEPGQWTEVIPHRPSVMLAGVSCFKDDVVLLEREQALPHITVLDPGTGATRRVRFDEAAYTTGGAINAEFDATRYRYTYQSFVTPASVLELDFRSMQSTLLKRTEVLGDWDPTRYEVERTWVKAPDGVDVPVTVLFRKGTPRDGSAPCLLYGYGSYGLPQNVTFSSNRFSLVDRGVVYAMAHVRGGGDLGETWHEAGRMANKMNTFKDFIACAEGLIERRVTRSDRLVIHGGSAGGLLVGAVTNLRPDLFKGVLSQVPFVDVINSMADESLPLTVGEFEEWGNPKIEEQYRWMRAYSPYDNLARTTYPNMLIRTSINDSQVMYWEPTKYVARLRTLTSGGNRVLFRCNMGAGHGGASGRYDALRDIAFDYAWILETVGLGETKPRP